MRLQDVSYDFIAHASNNDLYHLSEEADVPDDDDITNLEDLRERLILMKRKMDGSSHKWKHLFQSVKEETQVKSESLLELMRTVEATFETFPMDSLSEVLRKEGHLGSRDLLAEISSRMNSLIEHRSLVIVAGETNGGKSTFLNLLLGEEILPTDVLHCTFSICKIVYSESYSIKTLDHDDVVEYFPCSSRDQVKALLRTKVAQQEMRERALGSPIKEITLGLPADILKSGVTLVDTPGIGEDEHMDNVTINFVKSTHASAFIYIIKSDTAGGVQEDRLLGFLKAIKERYSAGTEVEAFDPRAATFVCHRWDNIKSDQKEKVKKNALEKLEYVWPGFEASQTFFFSTKKAMTHLPVDPLFVTDSFMTLLKGLKLLFERASHNAIKHQYIWLKYMLQPASHHLKSMITHCNHSNDDLEYSFRNIEINQNRLMQSSEVNSKRLQHELDTLSLELKDKIIRFLNFGNISILNEIYECEEIIETCSKEHFLNSKANRRLLDEMIIRCLLKHVDEHLQERRSVLEMESKILIAVQDHLGLFRAQINHIKNAMQNGGTMSLTHSTSSSSLDTDEISLRLGSSTLSTMSIESNNSMESFRDEMTFDTTQLAHKVKSLLLKRRSGKAGSVRNSKHGFHESLLTKMKSKFRHGLMPHSEPAVYVEERMHKIARDIREDEEIMNSVMLGYTEWIQQCVDYATKSIPKFIEVNNQLMDEIREHRSNFQRNIDVLRKIMEDLEPSRHYLKGYGLLYMDDINAEMLSFSIEQRNSTVFFPRDLVAEHRMNDDSGFRGSGSTKRKVQKMCKCLWAKMQGALIRVNDKPEQVVVKTYIYDMNDRELFSEIALLRCLDSANLAPFLGMTRIVATGSTRGDVHGVENVTEKVSAFIFKGLLVSARLFSSKKMTNVQHFIPEFVNSLLQGLNYIHRQGLVHMELNFDTIMVDRLTGNVQLCQMCKSREARLPTDLSISTQTCVCLSPNVLQGHEYESTDDLYAFGLLLWEILKPEEPPYKEERKWQLGRFIKECRPTEMLEGAMMQLSISDNVRKILRGTLLVSRASFRMTMAEIQSLIVNLSDEPAVLCMRSRPQHTGYRRPKPRSWTPPDKSITFPSSLTPEKTPVPPPRIKKIKKSNVSEETPEMSSRKENLPQRSARRQSEPAILISPHLVKPKKTIFQKIFGRRSSKALLEDEIQTSDEITSIRLNSTTTESSDFTDSTDGKNTLPQHKKGLAPTPKPKITSKYAKNEISAKPNSHGRRFSLQDVPCYAPINVSPLQYENIDIPRVLPKPLLINLSSTTTRKNSPGSSPGTYLQSHNSPGTYSQSHNSPGTYSQSHNSPGTYSQSHNSPGTYSHSNKFPNLSPLAHLQSNNFFSGSLPSLSFADESAKDAENVNNKPRTGASIAGSKFPLRSSEYKRQDRLLILESKSSKPLSPLIVSKQSSVLLDPRFGRSLQDIHHSSGAHLRYTTGVRTERRLKSAGALYLHDKSMGQRLGNSLQDISASSHSIEPIIEEKGDTTASFSDHTKPNNANPLEARSSFQKNYNFLRLSSPAVYEQTEKSPQPFEATVEDVYGSSSLASSTSSVGEFSTDIPGYKQKNPHGFADGSSLEFNYDPDTNSNHWNDGDFEKTNYRDHLSVQQKKSQQFLTGRSQSQDNERSSYATGQSDYTDSSYRGSPQIFSSGSNRRITDITFEDTDYDSNDASETYPWQLERASDATLPPPPPAIDVSKLNFGMDDRYDDDEDDD